MATKKVPASPNPAQINLSPRIKRQLFARVDAIASAVCELEQHTCCSSPYLDAVINISSGLWWDVAPDHLKPRSAKAS
jgi:hypothetical protein